MKGVSDFYEVPLLAVHSALLLAWPTGTAPYAFNSGSYVLFGVPMVASFPRSEPPAGLDDVAIALHEFVHIESSQQPAEKRHG